jgi:hypothetical protein
VLELDPQEADLQRLAELECEVFSSVDALRGYVQRRSEVAAGERDDENGVTAAPEPDDVPPPEGLERVVEAFDRAVVQNIERCRAELRYDPSTLRVMFNQYVELGMARRLLHTPAMSDRFLTALGAGSARSQHGGPGRQRAVRRPLHARRAGDRPRAAEGVRISHDRCLTRFPDPADGHRAAAVGPTTAG